MRISTILSFAACFTLAFGAACTHNWLALYGFVLAIIYMLIIHMYERMEDAA